MTDKQPYIYVYQTICEVNGKSYVGVHKTYNLDDGYIGCGISADSDAIKSKVFHKAVKKYGYASFRKYILSFYDTHEEAFDEERFIVNEKWVKARNNYNTAIGGRGSTSAWMDADKKEQWKTNISDGVKKWVANGGYEKIVACVTKNSTKRFKKGSENWAFGRPMANRKRIVQYSLNGDIIKIHDSINHAGRDLGTTPGNITSCCKGRYRTCKGFIFRYEQSTEDDEAILRENLSYKAGMKRAVQIFNKKGDLIIECKSIADAAKFIGAAETSVHLSFKNNRKYCKGYIIKKL